MTFHIIAKTCQYCNKRFQGTTSRRVNFCSDYCRFWSKVKIKGPHECWEWQANKTYGYGLFRVKKSTKRAHRYSWENIHGKISPKMYICHHCDNPCCVNPSHLFLGTPQDNDRDRVRKGRQAKGEKNGNSKLDPNTVMKIRKSYISGVSSRKIAAKYGVNKSTILDIHHRRIWDHI